MEMELIIERKRMKTTQERRKGLIYIKIHSLIISKW